jgi:hypothetical protein
MQPQPPKTRQSGPEAKKTGKDALHTFAPGGKPGGPIKPTKQGYENPGPTTNLRGVEPNTASHRGEPNPEQHGSHGPIGDYVHDPGQGQAGEPHGRGINAPQAKGRTSEHSTKLAPPAPDERGVRK